MKVSCWPPYAVFKRYIVFEIKFAYSSYVQKAEYAIRKNIVTSVEFLRYCNICGTKFCSKIAVEKLGGIDFLILNHIIPSKVQSFLSTKEGLTSIHQMMEVNFFSYVHLAYNAVPVLQQSKGSIVVVSSVAGLTTSLICSYLWLIGFI